MTQRNQSINLVANMNNNYLNIEKNSGNPIKTQQDITHPLNQGIFETVHKSTNNFQFYFTKFLLFDRSKITSK